MPQARTLWTIGYEGHDGESFVRKLRANGIERLVDVRELPLSRKPGFSKSSLALGLGAAGIAYTHLRALGTPRPMRAEYKASGDRARFRRVYRAHARGEKAALDELAALAQASRTAIMCVEAEVEACHRHVLGELFAARGWRIVHLR